MEIAAANEVSGWLVQDEVRAGLLQQENQLDAKRKFLLPLASAGAGQLGTDRLRDRLGVPENKHVAIVIGSIEKWTMATELMRCAAEWPEDWVLIVHDRYGRTSEMLSAELEPVAHLLNQSIFISDSATDMVDDLGDILAGVSCGLAFYRPVYSGTYAGRFTGKNLEFVGLAAGKISTYLRYGIPVIMNEIGLFADEARKSQFGFVAACPKQIKDILGKVDFDVAGNHARAYFEDRLDFNIHKERVYHEFLTKLPGAGHRANAHGSV